MRQQLFFPPISVKEPKLEKVKWSVESHMTTESGWHPGVSHCLKVSYSARTGQHWVPGNSRHTDLTEMQELNAATRCGTLKKMVKQTKPPFSNLWDEHMRANEMVQWLRVQIALAEDPSRVPSTPWQAAHHCLQLQPQRTQCTLLASAAPSHIHTHTPHIHN